MNIKITMDVYYKITNAVKNLISSTYLCIRSSNIICTKLGMCSPYVSHQTISWEDDGNYYNLPPSSVLFDNGKRAMIIGDYRANPELYQNSKLFDKYDVLFVQVMPSFEVKSLIIEAKHVAVDLGNEEEICVVYLRKKKHNTEESQDNHTDSTTSSENENKDENEDTDEMF